MRDRPDEGPGDKLPSCVMEFIGQVTKKMRYRHKIRRDVQAELTAHFEDHLRDCKDGPEREQRARHLIEEFGDPVLLAVLCRRAKKRCRPLSRKVLVRTTQALGVVVLYLILCSLPLMLGKPTIRVNYIEWVNNRGRPTAANAVNAKPLFDEAVKLYVPAPELVEAKRTNGNAFVRSCMEWFSGYSDEEKATLKQWLQNNRPSLDMLRKASQMTCYWPVYDVTPGTLTSPIVVGDSLKAFEGYRHLVFTMREQIAWEASEGHVEDAFDDCLALHQFGRHLQGKGFMNDQLVGVAMESICYDGICLLLHRSKPSESVLKALQDQLESQFDVRRRVLSLDAEKAFWYDNIQRSFTDDGHGGGRALKGGIPFAAGDLQDNLLAVLRFDYPDRRDAVAAGDQYFAHMRELFDTPPSQRDTSATRSSQNAVGRGNLLLTLTEQGLGAMDRQAWQLRTFGIATIVLVAIQRCAADIGSYPVTLEQLVEKGFMKDLPADPYGRGPLTYKRTGDGYLLYSWGEDLKDDGGQRNLDKGTDSMGNHNRWANNGDWVFWPAFED